MLSIGELTRGMYVTVLDWHTYEHTDGGVIFKTIMDRSYCGDVLEVMAVDLPYIVVKMDKYKSTTTLDTRRVSFKELSEEYVKALQTATTM